MRPTLEVYVNGDDALLRWGVDELDDLCLGFAVQRRRNGGEPAWLDNFAPPGPADHQRAAFEPSDVAQFRCFTWTDHPVDAGDTVSYRVMPVLSDAPRRARTSRATGARRARCGREAPARTTPRTSTAAS